MLEVSLGGDKCVEGKETMMDLLTTREMRSRIDDWSEDQEGPQCLESSRM